MIKIAQVITRNEPGGTYDILVALISKLNKEKYQITLILAPFAKTKEKIEEIALLHKIKIIYVPELTREINPVKDMIVLWKLYKIFKREKFQIVHTHTSKTGFLGRFASRLAKIPKIVHTPHGHMFYGYFNYLKSQLFIVLERFASKFSTKIIVFTELEKKDHLKLNIGTDDKFVIIPNGINLERFRMQKANSNSPATKNIVFVGRLVSIKGHIYFFEAMREIIKKVPETQAIIVGDGYLRQTLELKVKELNMSSNIIFLGERDDVLQILSECKIAVLSSLNEGMGLVLLEAQACGLPVVATRVGGIPEVVKDGETGILVEPKNSLALSDAIIKLLTDEKLYTFMSKNALIWSENFSIDKMVKKTEELYDSLFTYSN